MGFLYSEEQFFFISVGETVCILRYVKTTKGQKMNCIQLVISTQYMCVQLNKAKRFQLFPNPF